jgi:predicted ATP-dependent endonuclease of OLD family
MTTIKAITAIPPGTNRKYEIQLDGKNLIVVGGNGSGKTSFLREIWTRIEMQVIQGQMKNVDAYHRTCEHLKAQLDKGNGSPQERHNWQEQLLNNQQWLKNYFGWARIEYSDVGALLLANSEKNITLRYFEAYRQANIQASQAATGVKVDPKAIDVRSNLGTSLEQHLLNLRVRSALGYERATDEELHRRDTINIWFEEFEKNLGYLFEDESTRLDFEREELKFYLIQDGKPRFTFQQLSSGYSSILDIYADLLIRTEYFSITSRELKGIVIIDELDAHLHVSLQRRIFPFLSRSFPNVQFIISTHSPFVLTSVSDAIIYDITSMTTSTDLSMYSFEAVVEGLLGVPPVSKQLEEKILELARLCEAEYFDIEKAEEIARLIQPNAHVLDDESRMFYELAVNKILLSKRSSNV